MIIATTIDDRERVVNTEREREKDILWLVAINGREDHKVCAASQLLLLLPLSIIIS